MDEKERDGLIERARNEYKLSLKAGKQKAKLELKKKLKSIDWAFQTLNAQDGHKPTEPRE